MKTLLRDVREFTHYWMAQKFCEWFGHSFYARRFRGHFRLPFICRRCGAWEYNVDAHEGKQVAVK